MLLCSRLELGDLGNVVPFFILLSLLLLLCGRTGVQEVFLCAFQRTRNIVRYLRIMEGDVDESAAGASRRLFSANRNTLFTQNDSVGIRCTSSF